MKSVGAIVGLLVVGDFEVGLWVGVLVVGETVGTVVGAGVVTTGEFHVSVIKVPALWYSTKFGEATTSDTKMGAVEYDTGATAGPAQRKYCLLKSASSRLEKSKVWAPVMVSPIAKFRAGVQPLGGVVVPQGVVDGQKKATAGAAKTLVESKVTLLPVCGSTLKGKTVVMVPTCTNTEL